MIDGIENRWLLLDNGSIDRPSREMMPKLQIFVEWTSIFLYSKLTAEKISFHLFDRSQLLLQQKLIWFMLGQRFLLEISFILRPLLPFPTPILSGILNYKISCFETNWNGRNCFGNNSRRYYILIVCHIWDAVKKSPKGFKLLQLNPQIPLVSAFVCIYGNHYLDQQQSCFTSHCLLKYIFEYS